MIEPYITPKDILGATEVIKERLALTIRFLATGETYHSLNFQFRVPVSAISYIVKEVCSAIKKHIVPQYVKTPSSVDLMTAHDPRLWETLQELSQNLAIWTSLRMLVWQKGNYIVI